MTVSLTLLIVAGVLIAGGVYLLMDRTLTRILIGLALAANGVNVLLLAMAGDAGAPPTPDAATPITDALPQAMGLTAIVITLGTTAFGLALAYRSWMLVGHDEVADDVEDRRLAKRAKRAQPGERIIDEAEAGEDRHSRDDLEEETA